MNIILLGFPRVGKTYFGKLLAKELSWNFIDTDFCLEKEYERSFREKLSYREIFQKMGEEFFRALEKKVISSLVGVDSTVIALGGGAILDRENQRSLSNIGSLVYLESSREMLEMRNLQDPIPLFLEKQNILGSFNRMYEKRKNLYEKIEARRLFLEGKEEKEILEELVRIVYGK